jgi:hypothetical protein
MITKYLNIFEKETIFNFKSSPLFRIILILFLFNLNNISYSKTNLLQNNIGSYSDSIIKYQDSDIIVSEDTKLFQKFKIHLGAEVTNLVHIGIGFRVSDITMLEVNLATPIPNLAFIPVLGVFSAGTNIQLFDNKNWVLNAQIPVWFGINANESLNMFPSLNIGWFSSREKKNHYENIMIRGGISYFTEYNYNFSELRSIFIFFNLGIQFGLGYN